MSTNAKHIIVDTYLELINEYDYEKVSITTLVEKCNISRQTFYYHFKDIDNMFTTVFSDKTSEICKHIEVENWKKSAEEYISLLNRFDKAFRKMLKTNKFIFVYNLIYSSFYEYTKTFFTNYQNKKGVSKLSNERIDFLLSYTASGITGLVMAELQKSESNYSGVLETLDKNFNENNKR